MLPPLTHSKSRGSLNGRYAKKQLPYLLRVPVHSTLTDNWKTKVHRGKPVWCNERVKSNLMVITPTASHLTTFLWHYFEPHDIYLFHLGTLCLHHAHIAQSLYMYYVWYCPAFKCLLYPHSMYIAYWVFWHSVLFCWCYFALHACRIATPHLMNSSVSDCEMLNIHLVEFLRMFHIFMIRLLAAADFHMQQSFRSPSSFGCVLNFHSKTKLQDFPCRKACFLEQWTSHPERVAERWPYLPGPPPRMVTGEDAHGDHGCQTLFPWCQRMIGFMDPDSALWQHRGSLGCTWEKKHWQHVKCYWTGSLQGSSYDLSPPPLPRRQGIYSQASCYMLRILGLNLSFVWAWVIVSVCFLWGCGESADNNVLVWKVKQQGHRSWQLTLLWIVFCH